MDTGTTSQMHVAAIGTTAGAVWDFLRRRGPSRLAAIKAELPVPDVMVCMAIGWLAREGKLDLRQERRTVHLWLTE